MLRAPLRLFPGQGKDSQVLQGDMNKGKKLMHTLTPWANLPEEASSRIRSFPALPLQIAWRTTYIKEFGSQIPNF